MPTFSFINTETNEEFDQFFSSWRTKDEFLEANPNIKQTVRCAPGVSYNDAKKPDDAFRDILRDIKKGSGKGANINTF
jgi:hypothetical protein